MEPLANPLFLKKEGLRGIRASGLEGTSSLGRWISLRPPVATNSAFQSSSFGIGCYRSLNLQTRLTCLRQRRSRAAGLRSSAISPSLKCPLRHRPLAPSKALRHSSDTPIDQLNAVILYNFGPINAKLTLSEVILQVFGPITAPDMISERQMLTERAICCLNGRPASWRQTTIRSITYCPPYPTLFPWYETF